MFLALAVAGAHFGLIGAERARGRAIVNDGDTLTVGGDRIRLRGIDAPEFDQTCDKAGIRYECGREAIKALRALLGSRSVSCEGWERDRYERLLAVCNVGGVDIGKRLVETGWAVSYGGYGAEEAIARRGKAGLWAGSFERPREWRERHGGLLEREHAAWSTLEKWWQTILGTGGE